MSNMFDQSYNNPYHFNRHSLGDQYRLNNQKVPENTSWFTGGGNQRQSGSILRESARFVLPPSNYGQPRSQSYNKYNNNKNSDTEYNSEYVAYSREYYQPTRGLGKRLDLDKKMPFREDSKVNNDNNIGEYGKYDIPPALMKKLKMLEKQYGKFNVENNEETEDEKVSVTESEEDIIIPQKPKRIIKNEVIEEPKPKPIPKKVRIPTPENLVFSLEQEEHKKEEIPVLKRGKQNNMKIIKPELIHDVIEKEKDKVINKSVKTEKPSDERVDDENNEKPKRFEYPVEINIPYNVVKPKETEKNKENNYNHVNISNIQGDYSVKSPAIEKAKEPKPKAKVIEQQKPITIEEPKKNVVEEPKKNVYEEPKKKSS